MDYFVTVVDSNKFRTPTGKFYTRQLFFEEWNELPNEAKTIKPSFSLHRDRPGMVNFGKKYVQLRDPSGYKISQELLGDYNLWTALLNCRWFLAAKEIWDRELDAALKAEGMDKIRAMLHEDLPPAQQLAAAKYLANMEYRKDRTAGKGRPSKADVDRAARERAEVNQQLAEDIDRIRLVKNNA